MNDGKSLILMIFFLIIIALALVGAIALFGTLYGGVLWVELNFLSNCAELHNVYQCEVTAVPVR